MAYAFNKILGQTKDDQNSTKTTGAFGAPEKNVGQDFGGSDAGGGQQTGATNTAAQKAPSDFTKSNYSSAKSIIDRNQGIQNTGAENRVLGDVKNQYAGAQQQMNQDAADYNKAQAQGWNQQYATPDQNTINKAVSGDQTAYANVFGLMNNDIGKAKEFQTGYNPLAANEYVRSQDLSQPLLSNSTGDYSRGMAALDSATLQRGGAQARIQNQLGQMNTDLEKQRADITQNTQANAQKALEDKVASTRDQIKGLLTGNQQNILNDAQGKIAGLNQTAQQQANTERGLAHSQLYGDIQGRRTELQNILKNAGPGVDTSSVVNALRELDKMEGGVDTYIKDSLPTATLSNALSADQASDLNRILTLMGSTAPQYQAAAMGRGGANVDKAAYDQAMSKVLGMVPGTLPQLQQSVNSNPSSTQQSLNSLQAGGKLQVGNNGAYTPEQQQQLYDAHKVATYDKWANTQGMSIKKASTPQEKAAIYDQLKAAGWIRE